MLRILTALTLALLCVSCVGMRGKKHTYGQRSGAEVGGAQIEIDFRPEGSRPGSFMVSAMVVGGGVATFDGPFKWRVEAYGKQDVHQSLVVHRIRTRTEKTKRDEWYPASELGRRADFKKLRGQSGVSRARYPIPGLLKVMPEEDGKLDVWLDLSIASTAGTSRRMVHFVLDPAIKRQDEMMFLPVEIAENFGKDLDEMEDSMWD